MSRIVALDTETTGLDPDVEDVFEIATIDLDTGIETVWRIEPRPEVVAAMHPKAAEVNRYHERIADPDWRWDEAPLTALHELRTWLDGAHILGAVPDFDARHLTSLYRRFEQLPPRWHYHLIDVETLAVGWLYGRDAEHGSVQLLPLPWDSEELSRLVGVEPPADEERHTALGDARWVKRLYERFTEVVA
ncbi:MAG: 3'-5' exoribonuclease [Actinobacteria bacterium]|nr:3'-5' exoribonuclease [Actinomycetota bacterium]